MNRRGWGEFLVWGVLCASSAHAQVVEWELPQPDDERRLSGWAHLQFYEDRVLVGLSNNASNALLWVLDAEDGSVLQLLEDVGSSAVVSCGPTVAYFGRNNEQAILLRLSDGEVLFREPAELIYGTPEGFFTVGENSLLRRHTPDEGELVWERDLGASWAQPDEPFYLWFDDEECHVASQELHQMLMLDRRGRVDWHYEADAREVRAAEDVWLGVLSLEHAPRCLILDEVVIDRAGTEGSVLRKLARRPANLLLPYLDIEGRQLSGAQEWRTWEGVRGRRPYVVLNARPPGQRGAFSYLAVDPDRWELIAATDLSGHPRDFHISGYVALGRRVYDLLLGESIHQHGSELINFSASYSIAYLPGEDQLELVSLEAGDRAIIDLDELVPGRWRLGASNYESDFYPASVDTDDGTSTLGVIDLRNGTWHPLLEDDRQATSYGPPSLRDGRLWLLASAEVPHANGFGYRPVFRLLSYPLP